MSESTGRSVPARGPGLGRDVLVIVLAGAALGAAFNLLQLRAGDGRGLPWIKVERRLASLESLLPAAAVADSVARPSAGDSAVAANASDPRGRTVTAATNEPAPARVSNATPAPAADPPATAAPTTASPGPASAPVATTPAAPAIPDTREPLEAGYTVVKALHDARAALFVDARSVEEFAAGHIAEAVNLPFDDVFRRPELAKALDSGGRPIVAYCGGGDCELSKNLAFALIEGGHRKVLVYLGGTKGWTDAGQALVTGAPR